MTWERDWEEGRTPWDAGAEAPALRALLDDGVLPNGRALVPGAGSGYDVLALASGARSVLGVDLSPVAVARFARLRDERGVPPAWASMRAADFFSLDEGPFDLVWDYTFLCALPPAQRGAWADKMDALLTPAGELVTLIFPTSPVHDDPDRPPHVITPEIVTALLAPRFAPIDLAPPARSHPGREGREVVARWRRR